MEKKHLYQYKGSVGIPPLGMVDDLVCISSCGLPTTLMNTFLNAKTSIKKLQFGVDKCHKIHIGNNDIKCPELFIDNWKLVKKDNLKTGYENLDEVLDDEAPMEDVSFDKYLGDLISADGSNDKNIKARQEKGFGIIKQIMTILHDYSFGPHYFEVAVVFRNAMLINAILCNSGVWYHLTESNLTDLECVDESLLRMILETGAKTPIAMLYLELGIFPLRFIIMGRRVMYLHYLLSSKGTLLYNFFKAQVENPCKGDWAGTVRKDLQQLGITENFEEIVGKSTETFREVVKTKVQSLAFNYLITKKDKNKETSKTKDVKFKKLEMQPFLKPNKMLSNTSDSTRLCKFIFALRSRMVDLRGNFSSRYANTNCELCAEHCESQKNLLICKPLNNDNALVAAPPIYDDLFCDDVEKQVSIGILLREKVEKRKSLLKNLPK